MDKQAQEIANRKKIVAELSKAGIDTSAFTDEVIADGQAFWKLAETYRSKKESMMNSDKMKSGSGMKMTEESGVKKESSSKVNTRPALTEKARKLFQDRLDRIAEDKRDTLLPRMLKNAESQLAKAEEKGSKVIIRKLEAMIEMIQDEIDSEDDDELIDLLMAE